MSHRMDVALEIFRSLGDVSRLRILLLVRTMELSVGELAQVLEQSQPRVSRHVKILADAGLVDRRKEGSWVFVTLGASDRVEPVLTAIDRWNADDPRIASDQQRLSAVIADRSAMAAHWFEAHARDWDAIRSLHVAEEQVEAAMVDVIGDEPIGRLLDIGTGTGRMIELFAGGARHALGIDRSSEMLRLARVRVSGLRNADLRQADLYGLPLDSAAVDLAILHHVLHFAQTPAAAIAEAARVLVPGGRLLIADFAPHDREDLRTRDAHVRLGFSDAQIEDWFDAAGLSMTQVRTLEGGELTVKLWLGRRLGVPVREVKAA